MLELKKVSKYYYNKGMVTSGLDKVSLSLSVGEFIAITGESGSGKTTLLNVIAGLDTYEDGEMLINGKETSHYMEKDYELYRKKYISNIFQTFNLVNSYTVYQNIELVLLLNGENKKDIKDKVIELIKKVDLYKYRNTKVSKLSGGQKQRVGVARALAKNTPIILADEPTGNLDKRSSESIIELLKEVSKDKLVIIVTHNYDQIEKYVTRKITMNDGKVISDQKIKDYDKPNNISINDSKDITNINKLKLGIRNAFNIKSKFILLLFVYLFIIFSFTSSYMTFKESEYKTSLEGYNQYFKETSPKRIIINKLDKTEFTNEDYENIEKLTNVDYIVKNDLLLDNMVTLVNDQIYLNGLVRNIKDLKDNESKEILENDNDIIIEGSKDNYYLTNYLDEILNNELTVQELNRISEYKVKIKKVIYNEEDNSYDECKIYVSDKVLNDITSYTNKNYTKLYYTFMNNKTESYIDYGIIPNDNVPKGKYILPESFTYSCNNANCKKEILKLESENIYFNKDKELSYYKYYNKDNMKKLLGFKNDENNNIYINSEDYEEMFSSSYYQSSVFIKDESLYKQTLSDLEKLNLKTLYVKDTLDNYYAGELAIIKIVKVVALSCLLIALFFISYFVIKIILKSRNIYFATLRILGIALKSMKQILNIELLTITNIAYIFFLTISLLLKNNIIPNTLTSFRFLLLKDYIIIYIITIIMSLLISNRFSSKLFKSSMMNVYREEV